MQTELEKWISEHVFCAETGEYSSESVVTTDDLRLLFEGKVLVSADDLNVVVNRTGRLSSTLFPAIERINLLLKECKNVN